MIIGIEGPAGSGKSTMAQAIAAELDTPVIEGGAWYRALTYRALQEGISPSNQEALVGAARALDVDFAKDTAGKWNLLLDGSVSPEELYTDRVAVAIGPISQQVPVREAVEPKIRDVISRFDPAIMVGRHIQRILPEAKILRLTIDEAEVERRHAKRAGEHARPVSSRNEIDKVTAQLLGVTAEGVTTLDVTNLTVEQQAEALRKFITTQREQA